MSSLGSETPDFFALPDSDFEASSYSSPCFESGDVLEFMLDDQPNLSCNGLEVVGIDSDSGWEPSELENFDVFASDLDGNTRYESDWEVATDGGAIDGIEELTSSANNFGEAAWDVDEEDEEFQFGVDEAVGDFDRNPSLESDPVFVIQGDYVDVEGTGAAPLQQFVGNEESSRRNLPASARAVEDLPLVDVSEEGLVNGDGVCAICKDKFSAGEKVKKLPCSHCYHQDCILPWLRMRNTCPVCRLELPTHDSVSEPGQA